MDRQWCLVRGCVALADSTFVPWFCQIHGRMNSEQREAWSREHLFPASGIHPVTTRIEREQQ
jgi:hypothetical protein